MAMLDDDLEDWKYNETLVKEFEREQETVDENVLQEHNIEPNYFIMNHSYTRLLHYLIMKTRHILYKQLHQLLMQLHYLLK